jgi:hypothetical protein
LDKKVYFKLMQHLYRAAKSRRLVVKVIETLSQHDDLFVPTPLSRIRVEKKCVFYRILLKTWQRKDSHWLAPTVAYMKPASAEGFLGKWENTVDGLIRRMQVVAVRFEPIILP